MVTPHLSPTAPTSAGPAGSGGSAPSVWTNDTASRLNAGPFGTPVAVPGFLSPHHAARLERIRQARMLFRGDHASYYLGEGRTQLPFRAATINGRVVIPYVKYNGLKLATNKTVDLLFGAAPLLKARDPGQQASLDAMMSRAHLHRLFARTARECCYEGEAYIEAVLLDGEVYARRIDAATIFPTGRLRPDGQYEAYERFLQDDLATPEARAQGASLPVVHKTRWERGRIVRELWQLDGHGRPARALPLALWPAYASGAEPTPRDIVVTRIDENTITYVANEDDHDQAVSDYDGLIELQDIVNHKLTQLSVAIAKNLDPKLAVPRNAADPQGNAQASAEVYFFDGQGELPQYITWDAQLEAALKHQSFGLQGLLVNAEISPILVGLKEGAAPAAYKTYRLEAQSSLSMAGRKAVNWSPAVARVVRVCQKLELAAGAFTGASYPLGPVGVELRDGLPVDADEQANTIATKRAAGVQSVEGALEELYGGNVAAVGTELQRLREDAARTAVMATPPILIGRDPNPADDAADDVEDDSTEGGDL